MNVMVFENKRVDVEWGIRSVSDEMTEFLGNETREPDVELGTKSGEPDRGSSSVGANSVC